MNAALFFRRCTRKGMLFSPGHFFSRVILDPIGLGMNSGLPSFSLMPFLPLPLVFFLPYGFIRRRGTESLLPSPFWPSPFFFREMLARGDKNTVPPSLSFPFFFPNDTSYKVSSIASLRSEVALSASRPPFFSLNPFLPVSSQRRPCQRGGKRRGKFFLDSVSISPLSE